MLRDIFSCSYVPALAIRPAEMRALEELPETDKDIIFPFFMLSPWAGSNDLESSVKRIEKAYGHRTFILGLDHFYAHENPTRKAQHDFLEILSGKDDFEQYFEFVRSVDQAIPSAFLLGENYESLEAQVERNISLGKGVVLSVNKRSLVDDRLGDIVKKFGSNNIAVHIDGGWARNPLVDALWYVGACRYVFQSVDRAAIVISCTSFPKGFAQMDGVVEVPIGSRSLFQEIKKQFNNDAIIYGDWASTKPRSDEGGGQPKPRIDYALKDRWIIARHWQGDEDSNWEYNFAASELIKSKFWPGQISVWGEMRIEQTAKGLPFSIENAPANVASRINIHLHQQANFEKTYVSTDDPWTDDF